MKDIVLVDSNVLLDVITDDPVWGDWASGILNELFHASVLAINPVIYAEVSVGFQTIEELEATLSLNYFERLSIPYEAAFLAGKCFMKYKKLGGTRTSTLPDFLIGAHAAVLGMSLLTRDVSRYKTYFPRLVLICPEK